MSTDWPRPVLLLLFGATFAAAAATLIVILPIGSTPAAEPPADFSPAPLVTGVSDTDSDREAIRLEEIRVQLRYPGSWGTVQVNSEDQYPELEGIGRRVQFPGTGESPFGTHVALYYSTKDFRPGRELVFYEIFSTFLDEIGLSQLCALNRDDPRYRPAYSMLLRAEECSVDMRDGRGVGTFLSYTPALGGDTVIDFVRVVVFETGQDKYPGAALVLHYKPPSGVPTSDEVTITETYRRLREHDLDADAATLLTSFEEVAASMQFL